MDRRELFQTLLRRWPLILVCALVAAAAAFGLSRLVTPRYTSEATLYFSVTAGESSSGLAQGASFVQDQMPSFDQLATSPLVLNGVIDLVRLDTTSKLLARQVEVTTPRDSVVMQIEVTDEDPARAAAIANGVGGGLVDAVDKVGPKFNNGRSAVRVETIQTAVPALVQSSPNTKQNTAIGFLLGLLLAGAAVVAAARAADPVRNPRQLAGVTDAPLLGLIRRVNHLKNGRILVLDQPGHPVAEEVRQVRASLDQLAVGHDSFTVAVTSATRGEGRTVIAANLAAALAESGRRTVLVEADFRRPRLAAVTSTDPARGLLGVLTGGAEVETVVQHVADGGFDVVTAGGTHARPTALLTSETMRAVLARLRAGYDFVVIDTPPLLDAADAYALRPEVDGAIMLVNASRARRPQLAAALEGLHTAGLATLGVVMNEVSRSELPSPDSGAGSRRSKDVPSTAPVVIPTRQPASGTV